MDCSIRHQITVRLLLLILLGQFIGTAWSCPMSREDTPSFTNSFHIKHQAHLLASKETQDSNALINTPFKQEQEPSSHAPCCAEDSNCSTHHCSALSLAHNFEPQKHLPEETLQPPSYKAPIKRSPSAIYRPPITCSLV